VVATGQATASEHCHSFENDAVALRIPVNYRIFNLMYVYWMGINISEYA
jgi:hypothetical protein